MKNATNVFAFADSASKSLNVDIATWSPNYVAFPLFAFLATGLFVWPLLLELVVAYSFVMLVAVCCTYFVE